MTFPIFCAVHLVYGVLMAHVLRKRMMSEGEVLGVPLLWTLAPVGLVSAPCGALLLRFSGRWFLHGMMQQDGAIAFERFHLGLMFVVGLSAGMATITGMFFALALSSRDRKRLAWAPVGAAALIVLVAVGADPAGTLHVGGRTIFTHPAGLVSLACVLVLFAAWAYARRRLSKPVRTRG
jgi:hypothetical protein